METLSNQVFLLISVSLCAAAVSFTITTTSMFTWLRELVSPIHQKVEELIHCPWCLGHWIVFVIMITTNFPVIWITPWFLFNFLFTAFVIICPMGLVHYVLLRAYEPVHELMTERKIEQMRKKAREKPE